MNNYVNLNAHRKGYRWISCMLIVMMLINIINPVNLVYASKDNSDSWNVSYSLGQSGDEGIAVGNDDGDVIIAAREGEEIFFTMQLWAEDEENKARFKDTFRLKMPEDIYQALVDQNGEADEWFESDVTESEYLLELKEDVATNSNARKMNRASATNASASNADNGIVELDFQFVEELRKEADPGAVDLEESEYKISFIAPEDMVLVCTPEGYNCEIMTLAGMEARATSAWNVNWSLKITKPDGRVINVTEGTSALIEVGDKVEFKLNVSAKNGASNSFDEDFSFTLPKDIYEMIGTDGFTSLQIDSADLFEYQADDSSDPVSVKVSFTQAIKDKATADNYAIESGWVTFGFESTKEVVIKYTPKTNDDSCVVEYGKPEDVKPNLKGAKSVLAVFDKNGVEKSRPVKAGDYVLYQISATVENIPKTGYTINPGEFHDYFNPDIFTYVDIKNATGLGDIDAALAGIPTSNSTKIVTDALGVDSKYKDWYQNSQNPTISNGTPTFSNGITYSNSQALQIPYVEGETRSGINMYICLRVNDNIPANQPGGHYNNWIVWDNKGTYANVAGGKTYDAALTINSTTKMRNGSTEAEVMKNPVHYPDNEKNPSFKVSNGDIVTYLINIYSQDNTDFKLKELSLYVPAGLKLLDANDTRFNTYLFAEGGGSTAPTFSPSDPRHINGSLDSTGSFAFSDLNKGLPFQNFYSVERYTYKPADFSVIKTQSGRQLFVTCEVLGIDEILTNMGINPNTATDDERLYAQQYGYLLTAEVSDIVDINEVDVENAPSVEDEDSYNDNDPFNDWFLDSDTSKALKQDKLWPYGKDGWKTGEADQGSSGHVRALHGLYSAWNAADEDDFDYATLYVNDPKETPQEPAIDKWLAECSSAMIDEILEDVESRFSSPGYYNDYLYLQDGKIADLNTIVPYSVDINADGSRYMEGVTLHDQLPGEMEFLLRPDGKPIVLIEEIVETTARAEVLMDLNGDGNLTMVEVIDPDFATEWIVKNGDGDEYSDHENSGTEKPSGLLNGDTWDYYVNTPVNRELTINFGDISNNAFRVTYLAVVKGRSNIYHNTATVDWKTGQESDSVDFSGWQAGAGLGYGKQVKDKDGNWQNSIEFDSLNSGKTEITYKLSVSVDSTSGFLPDVLKLYDYITDLGLGSGNIDEIKDITYYNGSVKDGAPAVSATDAIFTVDNSGDNTKLVIVNKAVPSGKHTYEIVFTVVYNEVPYGTIIKNTFGGTTTITTPLKLDLQKVDGTTNTGLKDAEFSLFYEKDGVIGSAVITEVVSGSEVAKTLKTGSSGLISEVFNLDPTQISADGSYYMVLQETKAPDHYFGLGGETADPSSPLKIKLKVTEDSDGHYKYQLAEAVSNKFIELTTSASGEIQIKAKNYRKAPTPTKATLEGTKTLTGRVLADQEFNFRATLTEAVTGSTVKYTASSGEKTFVVGDADQNYVEVANSSTGDISFPEMTFDKAGTYKFEVKEITPATPEVGMTYSNAVYEVTVVVTLNDTANTLSAAVTYKKINPVTENATGAAFENTYVEPKTEAELKANKVLTGRDMAANEFTFEAVLKTNVPTDVTVHYLDNSNNEQPWSNPLTVNNSAALDGATAAMTFPKVVFKGAGLTAGQVYVFELTERSGSLPSVTYSSVKYRAKVTITQIAGVWGTEVKYYLVDANDNTIETLLNGTDVPVFTNTYVPQEGIVPIQLTKQLLSANGVDAITTNIPEFTFNITKGATGVQNQAGNTAKIVDASSTVVSSVKNNGTGVISFSIKDINQTGIYKYVVTEDVSSPVSGIDYSEAKAITVTFEVIEENGAYVLKENSMTYTDENDPVRTEGKFTNKLEPVSGLFKANKSLTNKTLNKDDFTFSAQLVTTVAGSTVKSYKYNQILDAYELKPIGLNEFLELVKNEANGDILFKSVVFDKAGTYEFKLVEETTSGNGITTGGETYYVQVVVSEVDHVLQTPVITYFTTKPVGGAVSIDEDKVTFVNTYTANKFEVELEFEKNLLMADGTTYHTDVPAYNFTISGADNQNGSTARPSQTGVSSGTPDGAFSFKIIDINKEGTYTYTIQETAGSAGIIYDEDRITVEFTIGYDLATGSYYLVENSLSYLKGNNNVKVEDNTFTNRVDVVKDSFTATKTLENSTLNKDDFSFTANLIAALDSQGMPMTGGNYASETTVTKTNEANGSINFGEITFSAAGTYIYEVSENAGSMEHVTYDTNKYYAVIEVTEDATTKVLSSEVKYYDNYSNDQLSGLRTTVPTFINDYIQADASLEATKKLSGRDLANGEFTFRATLQNRSSLPTGAKVEYLDGAVKKDLVDATQNAWVEVSNLVTGDVKFPEFTFNKQGTYWFDIEEISGTLSGMTYDPIHYKAKVVVELNASNQWEATVTYYDAAGTNVITTTLPEFNNTYDPGTANVAVELEKQVLKADGSYLSPVSVYNFVTENFSKPANSAATVTAATQNESGGADDGKILITISGIKEAGTFSFDVREASGGNAGIIYDSSVIHVEFTTIYDSLAGAYKLNSDGIKYTKDNQEITNPVFVNEMKPVAAQFGAIKHLENKDLKPTGGEFTFQAQLVKTEATATVVSKKSGIDTTINLNDYLEDTTEQSAGAVLFHEVNFNQSGKYVFKITEKDSGLIIAGTDYNPANDIYYVLVDVTEGADGVLSKTMTYYDFMPTGVAGEVAMDPLDMVFTNIYTPGSFSVPLQLNKTLLGADGSTLNLNDKYQFTITPVTVATGSNASPSNAMVESDPITGEILVTIEGIDQEGTYKFAIDEVDGGNQKLVYDDETIYATFEIVYDSANGEFKLKDNTSVIYEKGTNGTLTDVFVNKVKPIEDSLEAEKELENKDLLDGEFAFQAKLVEPVIASGSNTTLATASNAADGTVNFPSITFTKPGTYIYEITEEHTTANHVEGVTYDNSKYYGVIEVTEDPVTKELNTEVTYYDTYQNGVLSGARGPEVPKFVNTFNKAQVDLELTKKLLDASSGEELLLNHQYKFEIELTRASNSNAVEMPSQTEVESALGTGKIEFTGIEITESGIYEFTITEKRDPILHPGHIVTSYDPGTITATVKIKDENGALVVEWIQYEKTEPSGSEHHFDENQAEKDTTFINFHIPNGGLWSIETILEAHKELAGRTLLDQEFTFKTVMRYSSNGKTVADIQAKNDANGNISFVLDLPDEAGVYIFDMYEDQIGSDSSVTYDQNHYYVFVKVEENRIGELEVTDFYYGTVYDENSHEVSGLNEAPTFKNVVEGNLVINKVSKSNGKALAGAKFELAGKPKGSPDSDYTVIHASLITAGADGSVVINLPDNYANYEYRLIETAAPSGYKKDKVGTITFTVNADGTINEWNTTGSKDYVEVSADGTTFIIKNYTSGGSSGGNDGGNPPGNPGTPTPPTNPGGPGSSGSSGGDNPSTSIGDEDTPLSQLTTLIEDAVPLAGLARTGDYGIPMMLLGVIMFAAAAGFGTVVYRRRKDHK